MSIRNAAKAIIINNGKILLNKCFDDYYGEYYTLPGGGQLQYETMQSAVIRECLEETGYTVKTLRFAALFEEISTYDDYRQIYSDYSHKIYHIFVCEVSEKPKTQPTEIDDFQVSSEWISVDSLDGIRILPVILNDNIRRVINAEHPVFLGSEFIERNHG